ncbi:MAG: hypothetical protein HY231_16295 [Acidobacteria bacterium]|nr:hypothetical protein [Acidobacteriota bacterium]
MFRLRLKVEVVKFSGAFQGVIARTILENQPAHIGVGLNYTPVFFADATEFTGAPDLIEE